MATYNGAAYLADQLQSLARQTKLPAELVVADDGSTDETLAILAAFSHSAPFPVHVVRNDSRLGYRANFMKAVGLCTSDLIAYCDQDDVWFDSKLQHCVEQLDASGALMLYHNAVVTDSALVATDTLDKHGAPAAYNPPLTMSPLSHLFGFTILFDRRLTQFIPLWEKSISYLDGQSREAHDQWTCFLANALGAVFYEAQPLANYRRHGSTATLTAWAGAPFVARALNALHVYFHSSEFLARWENQAIMLEHRAAILDEIAADCLSPFANEARAGAGKYHGYARLHRDRIALYKATTVGARLRRFRGILASGGYRNADVWAKGTKSALKDLLIGVLRTNRILPNRTQPTPTPN